MSFLTAGSNPELAEVFYFTILHNIHYAHGGNVGRQWQTVIAAPLSLLVQPITTASGITG